MSSNTFTLGTKSVNRLGYGAMQLAGPGVFGPPRDRHVAITVLREALALGSTTHPAILFTPSHYLSLFVSILIFLNPFYYRAGCDEQQHIYSRYKIR